MRPIIVLLATMPLTLAAPLTDTLAAHPSSANAMATREDGDRDKKDPRAEQRFPQPVLAAVLVGRDLLQPKESQPVLGRVTDVVRQRNGDTALVVEIGGRLRWLGIGTREVAVPIDAVALLGEHVALIDMEPEELRALPTFTPGSARAIPPGETLKLGIVKPFH